MNDGNAKHDIEQATRGIIKGSARPLKNTLFKVLKLLRRMFVASVSFLYKRANHSMKALENDGPTKEISSTPPLTREEMKEVVAAAKENGVTVGIKKMTPDKKTGRRKSFSKQDTLVKGNVKAKKLETRSASLHKIKFLSNYYMRRSEKCLANSKLTKSEFRSKRFLSLSKFTKYIFPLNLAFKKLSEHFAAKIESEKNAFKEERYVVFCNKSRTSFLNDYLEKIQARRTEKFKENDLDDINKDGVVDEKDIGDLKARDMEMDPSDLSEVNEDYGDCLMAEFHNDYTTQKVTKEEYCAMRKDLFDLSSHAARTTADDKVLIAVMNKDLDEYLKIAPETSIKEYGASGGQRIKAVSDNENIQHLVVKNEDEWQQVKEKYKGADYIASHNPDGSVNFMLRQEDTDALFRQAQKKNTAEFLKEADEMLDKAIPDKGLDKVQDAFQESVVDKADDFMEGLDK